jgi:hypothetical protein
MPAVSCRGVSNAGAVFCAVKPPAKHVIAVSVRARNSHRSIRRTDGRAAPVLTGSKIRIALAPSRDLCRGE